MVKKERWLIAVAALALGGALALNLVLSRGGRLPPPPLPPAAELRALGDEALVSRLHVCWLWRRRPPDGADPCEVPLPARHLLAVVAGAAGVRDRGLVTLAISGLQPGGEDLAATAKAYEAIGVPAAADLAQRAAAIATANQELIERWRDCFRGTGKGPDANPFAALDQRARQELAGPLVQRRLAIYVRAHLDQLAAEGG